VLHDAAGQVRLDELEGKTRKEAARLLGVPEGTVAGRLARARAMLAKRLARHGVVLSGGALAAVVSQNMVSAGVPAPVVSSTIRAATLFAAGQAAGVVSAKVAALLEGVLKAMFLDKLKTRIVSVLVVAFLALGGGVFVWQSRASEHPARQSGEGESPGGKDQDLTKKLLALGNCESQQVAVPGDGGSEAAPQAPAGLGRWTAGQLVSVTGRGLFLRPDSTSSGPESAAPTPYPAVCEFTRK
jgi:hypothetical protein